MTTAAAYVGPRLRRLREQRGVSQAALAREAGVSASYLNQIERNHRPLTVPVMLRLTAVLGVGPDALAGDDVSRLAGDVHAALDDPEAALGVAVSAAELRDFAAAHPGIARALVAMHRSGTDARRRIEELALGLGARLPEGVPSPVLPYDEVLDFVYDNQNHFPHLDAAGEALASDGTLRQTGERLERLLRERHGLRVVEGPADGRRHLDRTRRRLVLPEGLGTARRVFRLAVQWALLDHAAELDRLTAAPGLSSDESRALARIGLANYTAGAALLPYRRFLQAAEATGYDVAALADRFGVGVETVCHRLSTLQRPGESGVPFVFIRVDRAGNVSKRHSATGFPLSRVGGTCPLWNVYEAFSAPGRFLTQLARMPDGRTYLWVACSVSRRPAAHGSPGTEHALALGCEVRHAHRLVYARGLALDDPAAAVPIGPGCRICERPACPQRAFPLLGRPLDTDPDRSRDTPYPTR